MAFDLATVIPSLVAGGAFVWLGPWLSSIVTGRSDRAKAREQTDFEREKHVDSLTFEVVALARGEIAGLKAELERLRPMEACIFHLEQAMEHLDALLGATGDGRPQVERAARAFVNRMRRHQNATGTISNEAQRLASEMELRARGIIPGDPDLPA